MLRRGPVCVSVKPPAIISVRRMDYRWTSWASPLFEPGHHTQCFVFSSAVYCGHSTILRPQTHAHYPVDELQYTNHPRYATDTSRYDGALEPKFHHDDGRLRHSTSEALLSSLKLCAARIHNFHSAHCFADFTTTDNY